MILAATRILPAVTLALPQTAGRVLAEPVRATMPLPRFDNAAMDGYAVRTSDVAGASVDAPTTLRLVAPSSAGQPTPPELPVGCACPIATGAPMPAGGDAVIMLEHAIEHGGKVLVSRSVDWASTFAGEVRTWPWGRSCCTPVRSSRQGRSWRPPPWAERRCGCDAHPGSRSC